MAGLPKGQLLIIKVYYSVEREQNGFLLCCCHPRLMWKGATDIDAIAAIPADQYEAEGLIGD